EPARDERHPLLDGLANQLADLVAVQEQLAAAQRLVVGVAAVAVGADVDVVEEDLAVLDAREAVAEVDAPFTDRLDLGPDQRDAGLEGFQQMEIVEGLAVLRDAGLCLLTIAAIVGHYFALEPRASLAARSTAAIMLAGSAMPCPAMSNAVP